MITKTILLIVSSSNYGMLQVLHLTLLCHFLSVDIYFPAVGVDTEFRYCLRNVSVAFVVAELIQMTKYSVVASSYLDFF